VPNAVPIAIEDAPSFGAPARTLSTLALSHDVCGRDAPQENVVKNLGDARAPFTVATLCTQRLHAEPHGAENGATMLPTSNPARLVIERAAAALVGERATRTPVAVVVEPT
jgi:hypothetical protein